MKEIKMTQEEVVALMRSSKSEQEWDQNCDIVKTCNDGKYPDFWFVAIVMSGLSRRTTASCLGNSREGRDPPHMSPIMEEKLKKGYVEIAAFVYEHCQKLGCALGRECFGLCCNEICCNITRTFAAEQRKVVLVPGEDGTFLKDQRCTVEPWLRPICSVHACDRLQCFAGDGFMGKYLELREMTDRLEYEVHRVRDRTVGADAPESEDQVREDGRP
jgi:hypothetical protein